MLVFELVAGAARHGGGSHGFYLVLYGQRIERQRVPAFIITSAGCSFQVTLRLVIHKLDDPSPRRTMHYLISCGKLYCRQCAIRPGRSVVACLALAQLPRGKHAEHGVAVAIESSFPQIFLRPSSFSVVIVTTISRHSLAAVPDSSLLVLHFRRKPLRELPFAIGGNEEAAVISAYCRESGGGRLSIWVRSWQSLFNADFYPAFDDTWANLMEMVARGLLIGGVSLKAGRHSHGILFGAL